MSTLADYYENLELAELEGVSFGLYTSSEIKKNSVLRVSVPLSFDQLGHPVPGGLYDRALGPVSESDKCVTCGYSQAICPGHIGHIELPVPVVHPLFHMTVFLLLKLSCRSCYSIIIHENFKNLLSTQMKLLELGLITEAANAERDLCNALSLISNSHDLLKAEPFFVKEQLYIYLQKCINANEENEIGLFKENRNIEQLRSVCVTSVLKQVPVSKKCLVCKAQFIPIKRLGGQIVTSVTRAEATPNPADKEAPPVLVKMKKVGDSVMMPQKIRDHLRKVWVKDKEFLTCLYPILGNCCLEHSTDLFFMDTVVVTPPCSRPVQFKDGQIVEPAYNSTYKNIIQDSMILLNLAYMVNSGGDTENLSKELKDVIEHTKGSTSLEKLHQTWLELQSNVDHLLDKDLNKTTSGATAIGVKQILEKKEGLFRMKMMGKRVNYCCRTVITPDPNLDVDEVGIPKAFAMKLSYPVPVTPWNIEELRRMIINGPAIHPGANLVLDDHGCIIRLKPDDIKQRRVVAKRLLTPSGNQPNERLKVVFRHLCNGDIMLLNRQPTLHRPSIMGHRARVLDTDKTFRMHYANCKSYNADFDGDEMNAHFPQNELARSEGYHLAAVSHHYLVPKDGTPLSGLIQDHVISGVKLSVRGRFFNRSDYQHLVFQALTRKSGYIQLLPPAIWKPVPLWSGKQVISTVILNVIPAGKSRINLCSTAKINSKDWEMNKPRVWLAGGGPLKSHIEMSEAEVIIREGELLNGVLDKTHYGATPYGLVHCMNELYGGPSSLLLLSCFSKLFGAFLQMDGFTLGVKDILVQKKAERRRTKVIENISKSGHKIALEALGYSEADKETIKNEFEAAFHNDPVKWQKHLDMYYKDTLDTFTNEINKICIPSGLFSKFPDNNLQLMIKSGAKGSAVNAMQISCLLGQIELEGKRPPVMKSGKSLPSFAAFDTSPRAGGFIDNRFMTGLKPQEFFFHCMAGREGLIDTAVKTSRSGYLQRCLVKHLEGLSVKYDLTVRDSDDGLVQFYYGEDGMDLAKSKFMNEKYFQFLVDNRKVIFSKKVISKVRNPFVLDQINDDQEQIMKWRTKFGSEEKKRRISPFQTLRFGKKFPLSKEDKEIDHTTGRPKGIHLWIERFRNANHRDRKRAMDVTRCPDPVNSKFRIDSVYGSISENMEEIMNSYIKKVSNNVSSSSKWAENIRKMVYLKSMTSICPPGEPVGLLAAQSIGEPSTQMTLNTFHFAGRGEMNVTLGIPRLREILMFASKNIKTPSMEIPFISSIPKLKKQSETLKRKFARVTLADVLEDVIVKEYYETTPPRCTCYDIRMTFLPRSEYKKQFSVKPSVILKAVEKRYVSMLLTTLSKAASTKSISMFFDKKKSGSTGSKRTGDDEDICQPVEEPVHVPNINESESSEDEPEADEDATSARNRLRRDESQEYEEPEEEVAEEMVQVFKEESEEDVDETAVVPSEDIESSFLSMLEGERYEETNDNNTNDNNTNNNNANKNVTNKEEVMDDEIQNCVTDEWAHMRRNLVVSKSTLVKNYVFDVKEEMWCEISFKFPVNYKRIDLVSIIKETASKCVVQEVPGIKKAIIYKEPLSPDTLMFKTDGINLLEIFNCDRILNLNKLYSNDINAVATTYGIEAACRVIVKEITNVFKVYGIVVDPRHLILVADYMTRDGEFRPMSRKGLEDSISPFQKMTFESSVAFLKAATLNGRLDLLESPSSCISLGVPIKMGTGLPEIMHSF